MNCYRTTFKARARKQYLTIKSKAKTIKALIHRENIFK
jgi:hypothetical protein